MDLAHELFRVTMAHGPAPSQELLFGAIHELGYTPSLADASAFRSIAAPTHPAAAVPVLIRKALDRAKKEGKKFVLVDCMGDN